MKECKECGQVKPNFRFYKAQTGFYGFCSTWFVSNLCLKCANKVGQMAISEYARTLETKGDREKK